MMCRELEQNATHSLKPSAGPPWNRNRSAWCQDERLQLIKLVASAYFLSLQLIYLL